MLFFWNAFAWVLQNWRNGLTSLLSDNSTNVSPVNYVSTGPASLVAMKVTKEGDLGSTYNLVQNDSFTQTIVANVRYVCDVMAE